MIVTTTRGQGIIGGSTPTTEYATVLTPRRYTKQVMGVAYCHGSNATDTEALLGAAAVVNVPTIINRIVAQGYPVVSAHNGGETWGNDTAISRVADDVTYMQSAVGAPAGKVILIGASMGGCVAMNYARANPTKVAALVLIRPVADLQDFGTRNGWAGINAAYGGAYNDATDGPNHSPVQFASQLAAIPTQIWYASDDTICVPSTINALAAGIGANATKTDIAPGGHADAADAHIDIAAVLSFLLAHSR